jgi:head-tail adaptor
MGKKQNIGELNQKITIRQLSGSKDDNTGFTPIDEYSDLHANIWARLEDKNSGSGESLEGGIQVVGKQRSEFIIRYRSGLDTTMRVVFLSENYDIKEIKREGLRNKEFLRLVTQYSDNQ